MSERQIIFGISGGSGAPIAKRLLEILLADESLHVSLLVSDSAREVFRAESGIDLGRSFGELKTALEFYGLYGLLRRTGP